MKNKEAQSLGKLSWEARSKGKTDKERSEMMSKIARKPRKKKKKAKNKARVIHTI